MLGKAQRLRSDEGVEAVEFALVVPVLLMIIAGIVNLGVAFNAATLVTTGVRDAARVASLGGNVSEMCTAMRNATSSLSNEGAATVTIAYGTGAPFTSTLGGNNCTTSTALPTTGDTVTVTLSYQNQWLIPIVLTGSNTITRSSQMRVE